MRNANIIISVPFLPPSLNAYRRYHYRVQRKTEAIWKEYIFMRWLELRRPTYEAVHITLQMLEQNCIIRKGIEGLDPDQSEEYQLKKWLKAYTEKRVLSRGERKVIGWRLGGARA